LDETPRLQYNTSMDVPLSLPRRVAVMAYRGSEEGRPQAQAIVDFLRQAGLEDSALGEFHDPELEARVSRGEFDLLVALGGDGTMLRAGKLCAPVGTPILGINLGRFGFLTEIQRGDWHAGIEATIGGKYWVEERMLLEAFHRRGSRILEQSLVINDVVVCRGQFVRPIRVRASVNGYDLTTYVADGVIASTPTGSTAYALAVGGPILPPELSNMLIIPVAPHLTMDRAIILSEGAKVDLTVYTDHEAVMSIDGRPPLPLLDGDIVSVGASDLKVRFIRLQDHGYFYRNIAAYMERNPSAGAHG
jgi:NAD+ kinase